MYRIKHSIFVSTPSWGDVYIASRSDAALLEPFWMGNRVLSATARKAASAWLSAEGWFAYVNGLIGDADEEILNLIAEA